MEEELKKPTFSQPGDIWILGRHRVICGDSTVAETYTKLMEGQKANLVLTDPPYNVDVEETAGKIMNDNMSDSDFYNFLLAAYKCMYDSLADDGSIYVWHADTEGLNFRKAFKDAGFQLSGCCIWKKNSLVLGRSPYQWIHEPCLFGWKQKGKHAVKGVANKIKSFLHFSVPDEGPLADFESWMPDFMQGLADGINQNADVVGDAVNGFAGNLAETISTVIRNALSNVVTAVQGFMEQVFETVKTVWANANTAIDTTMSQIKSDITSGWKAVVSVVTTALDNIKKVIATTWKAAASVIEVALNGIKKIVTAVWTAMKTLINTGQLDIKNVISTTWNAAKDVINTALNGIKSVVQSVWNAMPDIVRNPMNQVKDAVLSIWDNIRNGIGDRLGSVRDAVSNAMRAVYDAVMDKVNSSWSWGRDLMQNLINGLNYMLGNLINTVADVARAISDYLHFSVPDKGPLTEFESWMPDFMKGLADGINKSKKYVEKAISGVADAMTIAMNSDFNVDMSGVASVMAGAGGTTVVNNYNNDNSRTVNQTNNSPKSLSRLEIYRQTRNALNV